jgi:hypothetical protein
MESRWQARYGTPPVPARVERCGASAWSSSRMTGQGAVRHQPGWCPSTTLSDPFACITRMSASQRSSFGRAFAYVTVYRFAIRIRRLVQTERLSDVRLGNPIGRIVSRPTPVVGCSRTTGGSVAVRWAPWGSLDGCRSSSGSWKEQMTLRRVPLTRYGSVAAQMAVGWAIGAGYGSQGAHLIKVGRDRRDPRRPTATPRRTRLATPCQYPTPYRQPLVKPLSRG